MTNTIYDHISLILPAKNEGKALSSLLPDLINKYPQFEIIVVDDGSSDSTATIVEPFNVTLISHPYSLGNGAAIKTGARHASREILILMDADGQHHVNDIQTLIKKFQIGFDMVVGYRERASQASTMRWIGNQCYNRLASVIVNHQILDLTSGFRIVKRKNFLEFIHLLPNGFSYPSTITIAFFRSGYSVGYEKITTRSRVGKSHLNVFSDGFKFLLILYKMTILYSPFKVFLSFSALFFILGIGDYFYSYLTQGKFTSTSAILLSTSVIVFLIGLISEQITSLMYQRQTDISENKSITKLPNDYN